MVMNMQDWYYEDEKKQFETVLASIAVDHKAIPKTARMSKSTGGKSWTQQQYEDSFRNMRRGVDYDALKAYVDFPEDILKAADYSYIASHHDIHAWIDNLRRKRFHQIKWRILTQRRESPF